MAWLAYSLTEVPIGRSALLFAVTCDLLAGFVWNALAHCLAVTRSSRVGWLPVERRP